MMTLESRLLDVNFSEISRQITIKNKRIGKVWKQTPFHDRKVRNHAWDGHIIPARDYLILS